MGILRQMRVVAAQPQVPPPLMNSPKCPRCSLVGICLPDEVNALRAHQDAPVRPRRIVAADPDSRPLYVGEQGSVIGVRGGRVEVSKHGGLLGSMRTIDVSQVCVLGNITVTSQAMREFFAREIPVCWFSYGGWFSGMAQGLPAKNIDLRIAQFGLNGAEKLDVAKQMIAAKIRNSRTILRRNARRDVARPVAQLKSLIDRVTSVESAESLLGVEGTAARIYFQNLGSMLAEGTAADVSAFERNGRARRPPPDPVNAVLSFLYAMLVKDLTVIVTSVGFDPFLGVYHAPKFGRPALSLDLAEEFRPVVADGAMLQAFNNRELRDSHFVRRSGGCQLTEDGRSALIQTV